MPAVEVDHDEVLARVASDELPHELGDLVGTGQGSGECASAAASVDV